MAEIGDDSVELLKDDAQFDDEKNEPDEMNRVSVTKTQTTDFVKSVVQSWWRKIIIIVIPLILLPVPTVIQTQPAYAFYAISIIAVYWITEAVPLAVSSLLPVVLFPALGVLSAEDTASNYLNDTNMLFVGGLMVAVAIEKWNLHKRIALLVLLAVGSKPKWLLLGFMGVTAFLSMWISNTATAAMMLPISHAVLQEIREHYDRESDSQSSENVSLTSVKYKKNYDGTSDDEITLNAKENTQDSVHTKESTCSKVDPSHSNNDTVTKADVSGVDKTFIRLSKGLTLGIAYSANIGGTGTLTGTGPNLVLSGDVAKLFPKSGGVDFGIWFVFAFPAMCLSLLLSWLYLSFIFCDDFLQFLKVKFLKVNRQFVSSSGTRKVLLKEYKKLGPWKFAEVQVMICFVSLALLWLFRQPRFMPGWGELFKIDEYTNKSYFSDSSTVMFIVFLLFVLPAKSCISFRKPYFRPNIGKDALLDWKSVQHNLPWNVVLLLGSGFAIAEAAEVSGLSCWIGQKLLVIEPLPDAIKALTVSVTVACVTEVISNVATTTLFLPILAQLAIRLSINPLYLMIPAAVSASYAFMLPVATPPNAIAFSFGYLKVYEMVLTGILMNIMCIFIVNLAINTWAVPLFDLNSFPNWTDTNASNNCFL